jgi:hypothetical protein
MISAAIFQGALSAAGRAIVEQSEIIQSEIKVVRQRIEGWILKRSGTEKSTASSVSHLHFDADQPAEAEPRRTDARPTLGAGQDHNRGAEAR